jgi:Oxidoreductase molybdopterin binding domain
MSDNNPEKVSKGEERGLQAQDVDHDNQLAESHSRSTDSGVSEDAIGEGDVGPSGSRQNVTSAAIDDDKAAAVEMRQRTRRSFIVGGAAALAAAGGWRWLRTRREVDGLAWPLRLSHEFNEQLSRDYFSRSRLVPTFPGEMASEPRVNGSYGLDEEGFDPANWRLAIVGLASPSESVTEKASASPEVPNTKSSTSNSSLSGRSKTKAGNDSKSDVQSAGDSSDQSDETDEETDSGADGSDTATNNETDLTLTLAEIKQLPRVEMVTQLKCIEGWSVIVRWAGARLADLIAKYPPLTRSGSDPDVMRRPDDLVGYVSLETPDSEYYVGIDMESALHPQTLLCYEMNGQPLSLKHGAPLRLVIPVKYGIKNIKRIGKITYTDKRPADYWAERGYDWYSGH